MIEKSHGYEVHLANNDNKCERKLLLCAVADIEVQYRVKYAHRRRQ